MKGVVRIAVIDAVQPVSNPSVTDSVSPLPNWLKTPLMADAQRHASRLYGGEGAFGFRRIGAQRLLAKHMLARARGRDDLRCMLLVRGTENDGVNIWRGERILEARRRAQAKRRGGLAGGGLRIDAENGRDLRTAGHDAGQCLAPPTKPDDRNLEHAPASLCAPGLQPIGCAGGLLFWRHPKVAGQLCQPEK